MQQQRESSLTPYVTSSRSHVVYSHYQHHLVFGTQEKVRVPVSYGYKDI